MSRLDWTVLDIDLEAEADRIAARLRDITARELHRRGLVVAISGGIDSSVSAALAVRALGPDRVFTLILPERVCAAQPTPDPASGLYYNSQSPLDRSLSRKRSAG